MKEKQKKESNSSKENGIEYKHKENQVDLSNKGTLNARKDIQSETFPLIAHKTELVTTLREKENCIEININKWGILDVFRLSYDDPEQEKEQQAVDELQPLLNVKIGNMYVREAEIITQKEEDFSINFLTDVPFENYITDTLRNLAKEQDKDTEILSIKHKWRDKTNPEIRQHYTIRNNVLFFRTQKRNDVWLTYIPQELINKYIWYTHFSSGHFGPRKCFLRLKQSTSPIWKGESGRC